MSPRNAILLASLTAALTLCSPFAAARDLKPIVGLTLREAYDTNVFLRDVGPLANRDSFVTTVTPTLGFSWAPGLGSADPPKTSPQDLFSLSLTYSPSRVTFHSEPGENYWDHNLKSDISLTSGRWSTSLASSLRIIHGDDELPMYTGPGGLPATGAPAVRDRRDATIFRSSFKAQYTADAWFFRPLASTYIHDFRIRQENIPGWCNFADRSDTNLGADLGLKIAPSTHLTLGYRLGHQTQETLFNSPVQYSNTYQRLLVGIEGRPAPWLKLAASAGPDFRYYNDDVPDGFDRQQVELFVDASATLTPTATDEFTLCARRFQQPGAGGRSTYADQTYSLAYRHKFTDKLSAGAGLKAYNTDFESPAKRNDWVYTTDLQVDYKLDPHWSVNAGLLFESGRTNTPSASAREYDRQLFFLGLTWSL